MTIQVHVDERALRQVANLTRNVRERIIWRTMARARRQIATAFKRRIVAEIRARGHVDTGAMLRVEIKSSTYRPGLAIRFFPQFPRTFYQTPRGRGRQGASKQGQYAFVVNHQSQFIQAAQARLQASGEAQAIFNKHLAFIINQSL
ncbi:MAG: hypothetical protein OXP75_01110 [Rhodospirillales bacterium]|nr:hypothetical protein [Rhodospirillales bacterium]